MASNHSVPESASPWHPPFTLNTGITSPMPVRRVWVPYVDTCQEAERLLFLQGSQERRGSAWLHCWRHRASVRGLFHSKAPMFKKCLHNIEKPGKKAKRPLGIPSILDRIVQEIVRLVIEPILEAQ